jgi:hypothetical protein
VIDLLKCSRSRRSTCSFLCAFPLIGVYVLSSRCTTGCVTTATLNAATRTKFPTSRPAARSRRCNPSPSHGDCCALLLVTDTMFVRFPCVLQPPRPTIGQMMGIGSLLPPAQPPAIPVCFAMFSCRFATSSRHCSGSCSQQLPSFPGPPPMPVIPLPGPSAVPLPLPAGIPPPPSVGASLKRPRDEKTLVSEAEWSSKFPVRAGILGRRVVFVSLPPCLFPEFHSVRRPVSVG